MNPSDRLKKLKNYFKEDSIKCLDIGANIGQFYYKFKEFFPKSYIYLIEANPYCTQYLNKTNAEYKITALSDTVKVLPFYTVKNKLFTKGASFYPEAGYETAPEETILKLYLTTSTLDIEFKDQTFNLIKMDVQGSELDIIKGGTALIQRANYLLIEVSFIEYNKGSPLVREVLEELEKLNFFVVDVIDEHHAPNSDQLVQVDLLFSNSTISHNMSILNYYNI